MPGSVLGERTANGTESVIETATGTPANGTGTEDSTETGNDSEATNTTEAKVPQTGAMSSSQSARDQHPHHPRVADDVCGHGRHQAVPRIRGETTGGGLEAERETMMIGVVPVTEGLSLAYSRSIVHRIII